MADRRVSDPRPRNLIQNGRSIPPEDLFLYAQSFHKAGKTLAAAFRPEDKTFAEADASAVVFMYRHAVELYLKTMVLGEGGNFLATKPDPISVGKTHSVSWLAQFVCQIITAVKWEKEFRCEGVENLANFKNVVEELNAVDPGSYVFRLPANATKDSIRGFAGRMDAVLELLNSTADAMTATWDTLELAEHPSGGLVN